MTLSALGIFSAAGAGGVAAGDYELISTTILGSNQASVVFDVSSFASTYKHLQIRALERQSNAATEGYGRVSFNGVTTNQVGHLIAGTGGGVVSLYDNARIPAYSVASTDTANAFSARVIDILDPFSTTKNTTLRMLSGGAPAANTRIVLTSGLWVSTAAVTSITLTAEANYVAGSRFSIYGIKG